MPIDMLFSDYGLRTWTLNGTGSRTIVSQATNHGIRARFNVHTLDGKVNSGRTYFSRTPLTLAVDDKRYDLYIVDDYRRNPLLFEGPTCEMAGDIAERAARRIMKRFLAVYGPKNGRRAGLFGRNFRRNQREGYVIKQTDEYILRVKKYPNLVILKKENVAEETSGYTIVHEIDGLFDYTQYDRQHLFVMEAKVGVPSIRVDKLFSNCFDPLSKLFPEAHLHYVLFGTEDGLLHRRSKWRQVRIDVRRLFEDLKNRNVNPLLFTFEESQERFHELAEEVQRQYATFPDVQIVSGKAAISDRQIAIYDRRGMPVKILVFNGSAWEETSDPLPSVQQI